jgi:predicted nucleic acid-binding protein
MKFVVDASVAVKWYLEEPYAALARRLLDGDHTLIAPEHILAEVGQTLFRRFRQGEITREQVDGIVPHLPAFFDLMPLEQIAAEATQLACEIAYTVYDCLYVVAAIRRDCTLVTSDERLIAVLSKSRWPHVAKSLQMMSV